MRTAAIIVLTMATLAAMAASAPDASRGQEAFEKRCTGCHTLDRVKVGPPLRNVYGHQAGKNSQFSYSDAVKSANIIWDETTLDRWLVDTESVIPDNDMTFRLDDAAERADIIAYLKQLSGK
jgi:cytochrome c